MKVRPLDLQESQDATGDYKHTTKGVQTINSHATNIQLLPFQWSGLQWHLLISSNRGYPGVNQGIHCSDIPGYKLPFLESFWSVEMLGKDPRQPGASDIMDTLDTAHIHPHKWSAHCGTLSPQIKLRIWLRIMTRKDRAGLPIKYLHQAGYSKTMN